MSSLREAAERDRITVKIHNMNRSASRDSPPPSNHSSSRGKRNLSSMGRYDGGGGSSDERMTPDRMRRRIARSPSPRQRYVSPHRDEYVRMPREVPGDRGGGSGHSYKVRFPTTKPIQTITTLTSVISNRVLNAIELL